MPSVRQLLPGAKAIVDGALLAPGEACLSSDAITTGARSRTALMASAWTMTRRAPAAPSSPKHYGFGLVHRPSAD